MCQGVLLLDKWLWTSGSHYSWIKVWALCLRDIKTAACRAKQYRAFLFKKAFGSSVTDAAWGSLFSSLVKKTQMKHSTALLCQLSAKAAISANVHPAPCVSALKLARNYCHLSFFDAEIMTEERSRQDNASSLSFSTFSSLLSVTWKAGVFCLLSGSFPGNISSTQGWWRSLNDFLRLVEKLIGCRREKSRWFLLTSKPHVFTNP